MSDIGKVKSWQIVPLPEDRRCFALLYGSILYEADMYMTVQVEDDDGDYLFYSGYFDSRMYDDGDNDIESYLGNRIGNLTVDGILQIIYKKQKENDDDFRSSIDSIRWILSESKLSYSKEVRRFIFQSNYEEIKEAYFNEYGKDAPIIEY